MFNPRDTIVRQVSANRPEPDTIDEAAAVLRRGGLVAFPTETVYGLGANALDQAAVRSIFDAKGRPANNPIIVHVADIAAARALVSDWPDRAQRLAERYWPGPLTLVLPKRPIVPDVATGGGLTVGIRVPGHPVALALIQAAGVPIAAPSANRSASVSPTTADHVLKSLKGRINLVLDAGPTPGGLESTVVDLASHPPRILRPGLVSAADLEHLIGPVETAGEAAAGQAPRSPGMLERHYAPRAELICVATDSHQVVQRMIGQGQRVGWLRMRHSLPEAEGVRVIEMPRDVSAYSTRLYAALHELDDAGVDCIVVDLPPQEHPWLAVQDRLRRASHSQ